VACDPPKAQAAEIFLNANGQPMTRDGFAFRLAEHVKTAATKQPSILGKRVTPHVLRHSCAMHTLAATGDIRKVALWLGHASIQSTETYLRADPEEKLQIPRRTAPCHQARALQAAIRCPDHHAHRRSKAACPSPDTPWPHYYLE
jgi:site-specific recombinase XerD